MAPVIPVREDYLNNEQFQRDLRRYERSKANSEGIANWWNNNLAPAFDFSRQGKRTPITQWNTDLSENRFRNHARQVALKREQEKPTIGGGNAGAAQSNEGMEYVPGTPSGLEGHPLPIRWKSDGNKPSGDQLNIEKQPPQRPLRDADPLPTTLAEAYESLGPRAVGNTTLGRLIGTPNNSGFIELTPEMQQEIAGVWSNDMMSPTNVVPYDKSIFEGTPVAFSPSEVPVSFDYGDLKLTSGIDDHVMPGLTPKTGLQALRADEESQGLLYASGKYWAENADGKLEAIPTDLINGEGTARQQAIAFMQSKKQPIIEAIQEEAPLREEPLWGPTGETGSVLTPTSTQTPTQTPTSPEVPSILLGGIPSGFSSIQLPGSLLDTGRGFAEKIGGELGRRKAMEKGGNLPLVGPIILNYGENEGIKQGGETFDKVVKPFEPFFKQEIDNSNESQSNSKLGLVTAGEFKGLSTHREDIDKNGFPKYESGRFWTVPSDNPNALW